jgi:coproporphyrinogen III oxidase
MPEPLTASHVTTSRRERVVALMRAAQTKLTAAFEALDGKAAFRAHTWERPGGGGGTAKVLEGGRVLERGGINVSAVHGDAVPPSLAATHPGTEGRPFFATGLSMVLHPLNPYAPAFHANYRYFEVGHGEESGVWWFGGGADMTPNYPFEEDVVHFHRTLKAQCDRHDVGAYETLKRACDDYFFIRHRGEMRGVGGIFFDELSPPGQGDFERDFAFVADGLDTILEAYVPLLERRHATPYGERERRWQLLRRGRYVEFNLVYDRGTLFGLQTGGNIEAILMSMPPFAHWAFDYAPEPGSPEAAMLDFLKPRDWVAASATAR